ncbi:MAG: hypothetical protein ACR2HR_10190 [Euzebya sp.]
MSPDLPAATAGSSADLSPTPSAPGWNDPVELQLALGALKFLAVAAVPVVGLSWLIIGPTGALSAGISVAIVAGMYLMSGLLLSYAAKFGPGALMAAALGGFGLRLAIYALLLVLLTPIQSIHGPTLAVTAACLIVATLVWEVRMVSKIPNLYWIDARAARSTPPQQPRTSA